MADKELAIKLLKERCLECSICAMSLNSSLTVSIKALFLSRLDRRRGENSLSLPAIGKGSQLDILVEAMGRVNFDKSIHDRKGITEKVELLTDSTRLELTGWNVYNLPVDAVFASNKKFAEGGKTDMLAYYRATFNLDKTGDTFLDMQTWGKGMVWVNGKAIGRFWEIGPQQTLYMPGCWLKKGENEIIVLDLKGPQKAEVTGLSKPILDMLCPGGPMTHRKSGDLYSAC